MWAAMPVINAVAQEAAQAPSGPAFDVRDFGAICDGKSDDTAAIQKALNAAAAKGGVVNLPAGNLLLKGHIAIPSGVALKGRWTAPHHAMVAANTTLLATEGEGKEDGEPFIMMEQSSSLSGVTIHYPGQNIDAVKAYPWTIRGRMMHVTIQDVTLTNSYKGIDFGTHHGELHTIRNVFGSCLKMGVYVNNCTDIGRIENVHFNPHYWARSGAANAPRGDQWEKYLQYVRENLVAFTFGRSDWEFVFNTFCYGAKIGYHFVRTPEGECNGNFLGIASDGGPVCVQADGVAPYGVLITNGEFVAMNHPDAVAIVTGDKFDGALQLANCAFWGPAKKIAELRGKGHVSFRQCNVCDWGGKDGKSPAFHILGGDAHVTGCRFTRDRLHFLIEPGADGVIISENFFREKMIIQGDKVKGALIVRDNLERKKD